MTDSRAAVGMDRLPWLQDEPRPRADSSARELLGWATAAALLIAGASYWMGTQSVDQPVTTTLDRPEPARPQASVKLPEARPAPAPPPVAIVETPEVQPAPAPAPIVAAPEPRAEKPARPKKRAVLKREEPPRAKLEQTVKRQSRSKAARTESRRAASRSATAAATSRSRPLTLWPARTSAGASGRLVQIGAFGTRHQAKLGWRRMQRSYPAVARLPAVVVESRNSRGRRFYRFQIGTTSQAHSEVLCQRMRSIRYSCAVVGLPWKAKVER